MFLIFSWEAAVALGAVFSLTVDNSNKSNQKIIDRPSSLSIQRVLEGNCTHPKTVAETPPSWPWIGSHRPEWRDFKQQLVLR
jgi:hypothetical protein